MATFKSYDFIFFDTRQHTFSPTVSETPYEWYRASILKRYTCDGRARFCGVILSCCWFENSAWGTWFGSLRLRLGVDDLQVCRTTHTPSTPPSGTWAGYSTSPKPLTPLGRDFLHCLVARDS